ncbi:MAG TPA: sugar transferase [Bryobacteraceae bacterium]|nr:sugar transferase [Bryobacteraceae bacterium]
MIRLFQVFIPAGVLTLLLTDTLIVLGCFLGAASLFLEVDLDLFLLDEGGLLRIGVAVATIMFAAYFRDFYSSGHGRSPILLLHSLSMVIGTTLIAQGLISYFSVRLRAPLRVMLPGCFCSMVLLFAWRLFYSAVVWKIAAQRVLFVGSSPLLEDIRARASKHDDMGLSVVGYVDDESPDSAPQGAKIIGPLSQLKEIAEAVKPDRIIIGLKERRDRMPVDTLLELRFAGYAIEEVASFYEKTCRRISSKDLRPAQLIFSNEFVSHNDWFTGAFDVLFSLVCLILALPLVMIIAAAVKLTSRGPVLYRQRRVGENNVPFTLFKFRSMYVDAEKHTGAVWSTANDPRVTPVGRYLRKLRLDELPQFFNVLRREMSLVGPRPERPEFVKILSEKIPYYRQRHAVKPGITGWAQINYRYGETFEDAVRKLEYDLYYIKYMSSSLNNYILFATLKIMFLGRGAQ